MTEHERVSPHDRAHPTSDDPSNPARRDFLRAGVGAAGLAASGRAAAGLPARAAAERSAAREVGPPAPPPAGPIRVWQTAGTRRHAALPDLAWGPNAGGAPAGGTTAGAADVTLLPDRTRQDVLGFGAAFTDAACFMFSRLAPDARAALFRELYHPSAMGLNVGRCCVGSSDYATRAYSYDESPTPDPELTRFSIAHDRQWILPMLREARAVNPDLFLLASPWSPPGWMKDNNSLLGGTIRRRHLGAYAAYLTKFVQAYAAEGVPVHALTSQNEVDTDQDGRMPQCTWPQEVEVQFVGGHLGPALARARLDTRIWIIDHNYNMWGRALASFDDEALRRYADGVAWHGYDGKPAAMTRVHDAFPDKHAYWTEGGPAVTAKDYATDWARWGAQFAGILNNWARCIIAWNYALDEQGKPNIGPFSCGGLVTVHSATREVTRSGQYWAFAHLSRHVRRGARVFESTAAGADQPGADQPKAVAHVAFENPGGGRVLVLANPGAAPATRRVVLGDAAATVALPPESVTTLAWA